MGLLASQPMAKKSEFIRIRADEALKEALSKAAERDVRSESDEARYLLMKSLGLIAEETAHYETRGAPPQKKRGSGQV